jgi:hypothetical protein
MILMLVTLMCIINLDAHQSFTLYKKRYYEFILGWEKCRKPTSQTIWKVSDDI